MREAVASSPTCSETCSIDLEPSYFSKENGKITLLYYKNTHLKLQSFGFLTLIESSACITMNQIIFWIKLHVMMVLKEQSKKNIQTKQVENIKLS